MALTAATKEASWLRGILWELGFPRMHATPLLVDNEAAVELAKEPKFHSRTKHIQVAFGYVREQQQQGTVAVSHIRTHQQPADFLTKNVGPELLQEGKRLVGLRFPPRGLVPSA